MKIKNTGQVNYYIYTNINKDRQNFQLMVILAINNYKITASIVKIIQSINNNKSELLSIFYLKDN